VDKRKDEPLVVVVLDTFVDKASIVVVDREDQEVARVDDLVCDDDVDFDLFLLPYPGFSFVVGLLPRLLLPVEAQENQNLVTMQLRQEVVLTVAHDWTCEIVDVDCSVLAKHLRMDLRVAAFERNIVGGFSVPADAVVPRMLRHVDSTVGDFDLEEEAYRDPLVPWYTLLDLDVGAFQPLYFHRCHRVRQVRANEL
jgi:hypothetical protein